MAGFNFERDLPHQNQAVAAILDAFNGFGLKNDSVPAMEKVSNPEFAVDEILFGRNVAELQRYQGISKGSVKTLSIHSRVLDVQMETGTGKTYTYTKALFVLNKEFGITKFIVVVPTLSIKAGTVSFLRSSATREHFKQDYHKTLKVHVVESQKAKGKAKKIYMPEAVVKFVEAPNNTSNIHVLVINAGMINSSTMRTTFDRHIFDAYDSPFAALASVKPLTIIDEPHKFPPQKTTWDNIQQFGSQFILRFGATFDNRYYNLIHELTAVDAFNQDLVKGVVTYVEEFEDGQNIAIKLLRLYRDEPGESGKSKKILESVFELNQAGSKETFKLIKGESLGKIHPEMAGVIIEKHNQSVVLLSNGLELKKGDTINPYSYAESLQDKMMASAVKRHFDLERTYLTRPVKIKPLTLFFIDDIEGYRGDHQITGNLKTKFESFVKAHAEALLKIEQDPFYKKYLEKTLKDLTLVHGGYFSKDNTDNDEKIEQEINEILHDKETLLSLDNPRRFIFSKWTLREGWDNPNVFQICKLRSSGSQTSKLQEVGRGLRLPVNEFMSRVKGEKFDLHYYVDFTERDFTNYLVNEINSKSGFIPEQATKLTDDMIQRILQAYPGLTDEDVLESLYKADAIKMNREFKDGGFEIMKANYPLALDKASGLKGGKIKSGDKQNKNATLRVAKYDELKALWETINQRVILEYKIDSEAQFQSLLKAFFLANKERFKPQGSITRQTRIEFKDSTAFARDEENLSNDVLPMVTMSYKTFALELARSLSINLKSLHAVFIDIQNELDINLYLSHPTIRAIRAGFNKYLLDHAFSQYHISYQQVSNKVHPTVFTTDSGSPLKTVSASSLGTQFDGSKSPADSYLFEEVFYDSDLERDNILAGIKEVTVFTKIPKNSIRIPVAGGETYSPDFAYVVDYEDGSKSLSLIVETKDKDKRDLFKDEQQKIKHAEELFNSFGHGFKVSFETQFKSMTIKDIIKKAIAANHNAIA
jgi:type III restriction enzyme